MYKTFLSFPLVSDYFKRLIVNCMERHSLPIYRDSCSPPVVSCFLITHKHTQTLRSFFVYLALHHSIFFCHWRLIGDNIILFIKKKDGNKKWRKEINCVIIIHMSVSGRLLHNKTSECSEKRKQHYTEGIINFSIIMVYRYRKI